MTALAQSIEKRVSTGVLTFLMLCALATTVFAAYPEAPIDLASAEGFIALAKTGVTKTFNSTLVGHIGVSPAASSAITGFGLVPDASNQFSKSALLNGNIYAADYAQPTPTMLSEAISDMDAAYADAAGRTSPDFIDFGAGAVGDVTLSPGLYRWDSNVSIVSDIIFTGNETDVWIFQVNGSIKISNGKTVSLSDGVQTKNIFWQVTGETVMEDASEFRGIVLGASTIHAHEGAQLFGAALSQEDVIIDSESVLSISGSQLPPTTAVLNPGRSWTNTDFNLTLNATGFNGTSVVYINYTFDGVPGQINGSVGTIAVTDEGNHTLTFLAYDEYANIEPERTIFALLDKTPPNITAFALPLRNWYMGDTITGSCNATDDLDINIATTITGSTASYGLKNATCNATDAAGNPALVVMTDEYTVSRRPSNGTSDATPVCNSWSSCASDGTQTRTCKTSGTTTTEERGCTFVAAPATPSPVSAPSAVSIPAPSTVPAQAGEASLPLPSVQPTQELAPSTTSEPPIVPLSAGPSNMPSWWQSGLVFTIMAGLVVVGYIYLAMPAISKT